MAGRRGLRALLRLHEPVRRRRCSSWCSRTICCSSISGGKASGCAAICSSASGTGIRPTATPRARPSSSRASATPRWRSACSSSSTHLGTLDIQTLMQRAAAQWPTGLRAADRRRGAAPRRRGRQVGAAAAADLAARRDGRPDAGQRADPRRDDGDGGRLPDRAHARAVHARARRCSSPWRSSAPRRCCSPAAARSPSATSSACSPTRRSARSATCSSRSASAPGRPRSSTS